jgi:hypothetical protein
MNVVPTETAHWGRQRRSVPPVTIVTTGSRTVTVGIVVTTVSVSMLETNVTIL